MSMDAPVMYGALNVLGLADMQADQMRGRNRRGQQASRRRAEAAARTAEEWYWRATLGTEGSPMTASSSRHATVMTIGALSRRTGVPVKALREYEDLGLIYTVGRSAGNYRLFDEEALWCVGVIATLRGLGMTLAEIGDLAASYLQRSGEPIGPRLAEVLDAVRGRTENRIAELREVLRRIDDYRSQFADQLAGRADFRASDPHFGAADP
jgi:MerR family copper efflux transcriptional regulator